LPYLTIAFVDAASLLVPFFFLPCSLGLFPTHFPASSLRHWHHLDMELGWFKRSLKRLDEKLASIGLDDIDEI